MIMFKFRIVSFILLTLNSTIARNNYVCKTGEYEGADPYHIDENKKATVAIETQLHDELTFFNKVRNFVMWNFRDHLLAITREESLNLCKCVYGAMTKRSKFERDDDEMQKYLNANAAYEKIDPNTGSRSERSIKSTNINCYINKFSFTLEEGHWARWCIGCFDIYIMIYYLLNKPGSPKYFHELPESVRNENEYQGVVIGKVNAVRFDKLLIEN